MQALKNRNTGEFFKGLFQSPYPLKQTVIAAYYDTREDFEAEHGPVENWRVVDVPADDLPKARRVGRVLALEKRLENLENKA